MSLRIGLCPRRARVHEFAGLFVNEGWGHAIPGGTSKRTEGEAAVLTTIAAAKNVQPGMVASSSYPVRLSAPLIRSSNPRRSPRLGPCLCGSADACGCPHCGANQRAR